jgi:hypothetical protein
MTYGVEFYNNTGKLQLSSDLNNFYMIQKGTVTTTGTLFFNITPTVPYEAIAVVPTNTEGILPKSMFSSVQAANTTQTFRKSNTNINTISWYAFRSYSSLTKATSGYGMEIYDDDGTTVRFSSLYPKILKGIKIPVPDATGTTTTVDANKVYAFLQYGTTKGTATVTEPMGGGTFQAPTDRVAFRASSTSIQTTQVTYRRYATLAPTAFTGGILAVDVTNY